MSIAIQTKKKNANPKKLKNPIASVQAVRKTPEAAAGSTSKRFKIIGIEEPSKPAIVKLIVTALANTALKPISANNK